MKHLLRSVLVIWCCVTALVAADSTPLPSADGAWAQLVRDGVVDSKFPASFRAMTGREKSDWFEANAYLIQARGLEFIQNYPTDPRRWKLVQAMIITPPRFITGYGPKIATDWRDVVSNEDAVAAWSACLDGMLGQMRRATDVPKGVLESTISMKLLRASVKAEMTAERGGRVDWDGLIRGAEEFFNEFPQGSLAPGALRHVLNTFGRNHTPAESRALFARYTQHPCAAVAEFARGSLRSLDFATTPMELKFTAVDGRKVDLAQLRGKVVLIDFWATWCEPCKAEIPNVKKVYAAYHDKGLEIVGVALENSRYQLDDTPEQHAEKQMKAKKKLTDFTAQNEMPWPQYFDGKFWKTEISERYAVSSIPAMFLLDREGKLVTTHASGEKLEQEVKRLLQL